MRTIEAVTVLDASAEVVWAAVQTPQAFVHVAGSMLRYPVAERRREPWQVGDTLTGWTLLGGVIPFSHHTLRVVTIDDSAMELTTSEGGGLVKRWDHEILVEATGRRRCRYRDRVLIDAGAMTPIVVVFAKLFYRYRQRRWRNVAPLLDASAGAPGVR